MSEKHVGKNGFSDAMRPLINNPAEENCVSKTMHRFNTKLKAQEYGLDLVGTARDRREKRCIISALANVPHGAHILDLPCGNGRFLPLLKKLGYRITAADSSGYMVRKVRHYVEPFREDCVDKMDNFHIVNIFDIHFEDDCFDAVVCNRLFHHFNEPEVRRQALKGLRRICSGPIVVSFFCKFAIDAITSRLSDMVRGKRTIGRIPISYKTFEKEAHECGLIVERWIPARPFISKQWYAVLRRDNNVHIRSARLYDVVEWAEVGRKISRVAAVVAVILLGGLLLLNMRAIVDPHEFEVERIAREYQDGNDKFYVSADDDLEDLRTNDNLSVIANVDEVDDKVADDISNSKDSYFLISEKDAAKLKNTPIWAQLSFIRMVHLKNEHFILLSTENVREYSDVLKHKLSS